MSSHRKVAAVLIIFIIVCLQLTFLDGRVEAKKANQTTTRQKIHSKVFNGILNDHSRISGYATQVSLTAGQPLNLKVNSNQSWNLEIYRQGFYRGSNHDGKIIYRKNWITRSYQPAFRFISETRTVDAGNWNVTISIPTLHWTTGLYLARLSMYGNVGFIPFVIRSEDFTNKTVYVASFQTMQAYNNWGGYSGYRGLSNSNGERASLLSFDRPWGNRGLQQYLYNEVGVAKTIDELGKNVAWTTDYDISVGNSDLTHARTIVTSGHSEYWSPENRDQFNQAIENGSNVMFMGGNTSYWKIRYQTESNGVSRGFYVYKSHSDPISSTNPTLTTHLWRKGPYSNPESNLTVGMYNHSAMHCGELQDFPSQTINASWFGFKSLKLKNGYLIKGLANNEVDQIIDGAPIPRSAEVLLHSSFRCRGNSNVVHRLNYDMTYYTTASNSAVWSAGTVAWGCALSRFCAAAHNQNAKTTAFVYTVTKNVLQAFSNKNVASQYSSKPNVTLVYPNFK